MKFKFILILVVFMLPLFGYSTSKNNEKISIEIDKSKKHYLTVIRNGVIKNVIAEGEDIILIAENQEYYSGMWNYVGPSKIKLTHRLGVDTLNLADRKFNFHYLSKKQLNFIGGLAAVGIIYYGIRLDKRNRPDSTILQFINLQIAGFAIVIGSVGVFATIIRYAKYSTFYRRKAVTVHLDYKL